MSKNNGGQRSLTTRVKSARNRKTSSTRWLQRQLNDPYVQQAKRDGYRSRAAYKLLDMQEKYHLLKAGYKVIDLGAAPGGWSQIAANIVNSSKRGMVLAVDLLAMPELPGCTVMQLDFMSEEAPEVIKNAIGGEADVVMSDMAPSFTGHASTDHLRTMALVEAAFMLATEVLKTGGHFVAKIIQGSDEKKFVEEVKQHFAKVHYAKPPASRSDSAEHYIVALEYKGTNTTQSG